MGRCATSAFVMRFMFFPFQLMLWSRVYWESSSF